MQPRRPTDLIRAMQAGDVIPVPFDRRAAFRSAAAKLHGRTYRLRTIRPGYALLAREA